MPLPDGGNIAWPPEHCGPINTQIAAWAAWYSGDAEQLAAIYAGDGSNSTAGRDFFASETGGMKATARRVFDRVRRWFWGNRNPSGQPSNRLHVPIAGDIASASADLLFSEPPAIKADDEPTQARLVELFDDGAHATLLEAAEISAALGGVYLRVCWDETTVPDRPWLGAVHPDAAVPEWSFSHLTAVTFWRVIKTDKRTVVRHLERHEPGVILHGVYEGTDEHLGMPVPFDAHEETAWLTEHPRLTNGNEIPTGLGNKLAAVYVPNMRPNRVWRNTSQASALGRSDYAGVEALMDGLDLTYSSLIRDVELGKARLIVPQEYMTSHGKGQGASVDLDREVYEAVRTMGADEGKIDLKEVQFDIRVDEHEAVISGLKTTIVSSAGYSAATFGLDTEGSAMTATEVAAKSRRSLITRDRKTKYFGPGLADITEALLGVDAEMFGTAIQPQRPTIEWPDAISEDPKAVAERVELWGRAEAASTETRVRELHPDWDDPQVTEEVQRIRDESAMGVDPAEQFGDEFRAGEHGADAPPDAPPDEE
ncbi:phage portal protein [Actinomadura sp. KC06]|uniref:phage portal protein n=1 Tax=Actinomadura sp. KC06 TaxID=2530369 RepID=UPI0010441A31|nr:phage portal protein [Actinomadura sp. KC06]TDD24997.1 phage portal protein [Actinomadura sp. KC06]